MKCTNYSSEMIKEGDPSTPSLRFLVLTLPTVAGQPRYCRRKEENLRACPGAALLLGSLDTQHRCCWVLRPRSPARSLGRKRKVRPYGRGSRLAHRTCRGRSRLCLPGRRRAAGRSHLRPNRRGLRESEARRPPVRTPCFPPHNILSGGRQSLALVVRPELSRPPVQYSTVCHSAVPRAPAFHTTQRDYLLWLFPQRLSLRSGHLELPDSSAAAAAATRTVEASGSGGRESRAVAHVLSASGPVELWVRSKNPEMKVHPGTGRTSVMTQLPRTRGREELWVVRGGSKAE